MYSFLFGHSYTLSLLRSILTECNTIHSRIYQFVKVNQAVVCSHSIQEVIPSEACLHFYSLVLKLSEFIEGQMQAVSFHFFIITIEFWYEILKGQPLHSQLLYKVAFIAILHDAGMIKNNFKDLINGGYSSRMRLAEFIKKRDKEMF